MGWFGKKEQKEVRPANSNMGLPELPRLPELPVISSDTKRDKQPIHQLPSFPSNPIGDKFSQNTIKDAISGRKEDEEVSEANELASIENEVQMMPEPLKKPSTREFADKFKDAATLARSIEPVFIRIDKFEESMKVFERTKEQITEMEKMVRDIKKVKEEEEKELTSWENEIQSIKKQIEKVDSDVFSRIE